MSSSVTVDTSAIERNLKQFLGDALVSELNVAKKEISDRILSYARSNHNYKSNTGNLRGSTKVSGDVSDKGLNIVLYVDSGSAPYSKYVIKGTSKTAPDPFLTEAIDANSNWIYIRLQKALDAAIIKQNQRR